MGWEEGGETRGELGKEQVWSADMEVSKPRRGRAPAEGRLILRVLEPCPCHQRGWLRRANQQLGWWFHAGAGGGHSTCTCLLQAESQSAPSPAMVPHEKLPVVLQDTRGKLPSLEVVTVGELGGQVPQNQVSERPVSRLPPQGCATADTFLFPTHMLSLAPFWRISDSIPPKEATGPHDLSW